MKSPYTFIGSEAWIEWTPRTYCLFDRVSVVTADVKAASEQVLGNVAQSQTQPLLMYHVKQGRCHVDEILPQEYKPLLAKMVVLIHKLRLVNQGNSHEIHIIQAF